MTGRGAGTKGGQGQWALGEREPLNANEKFKLEDDALNVRARIEQVYAKEGFDSITADDLHGRFRWWGIYTQRKQGIDGGKTATLEPHELEDKYFMLRIRIDGGALTTEQLRVIGQISRDFARDTADLTDRQNIQLHWIGIEDVPEIWSQLEAVGLQTTEACGDCPRVVLGSPVAGISKDELIDPTWAIEEIKARFIGNPDFSNLPRKYKTALSGMLTNDVVHEINDISIKYYLTAMLFIIFDIESVFLYPFAVAFNKLGVFALVEMVLFIITVFVAYAYVWRRGGLEWD